MLILTDAPNGLTPTPMGRPVAWRVLHTGLVQQVATATTYTFTVTATGPDDGTVFRLRGAEFATDGAERFTASTFQHDNRSAGVSAFNLVGMLRRHPAFRDFQVRSQRPERGSNDPWRVVARRSDAGAESEPELAADNDLDALPGVTVFYQPGRDEVRGGDRLYYRTYDAAGPIGPERYAPFDAGGGALIDVRAELRDRLTLDFPADPDALEPFWEEDGAATVSVRYGTYRPAPEPGRPPVYGEVHEADPVPVVASLFQPWEDRAMEPYGPNREPAAPFGSPSTLLPWLTVRPDVRRGVVPEGYAWTSIYLGPVPNFGIQRDRRLKRTTYTTGPFGPVEVVKYFPLDRTGILTVPTGGQLARPLRDELGIALTRVTYQTELGIEGLIAYTPESTLLDVSFADHPDDCRAGELYLLEGRGSWLTVPLERVEQRSAVVNGTTASAPLAYASSVDAVDLLRPGFVPYDRTLITGGSRRHVQPGSEVFRVRAARLRGDFARRVAYVMHSPYGVLYLTDSLTGEKRFVRVLFAPEELALYAADGAGRLELTLTATVPTLAR